VAWVLTHPFDFLAQQLSSLGGLVFLYAVFSLNAVAYAYMHYKSAYAAGAVALALGLLGVVVPEVAQLGFTLALLGAAAVLYRLFKEVVG